MSEVHICLHDTCQYNRQGLERYQCQSSSGLRRHHQYSNYHPCCQDGKCRVGLGISQWKSVKRPLQSLPTTPPKVKPLMCTHDNCRQSFSSQYHRTRHENAKHFRCTIDCPRCNSTSDNPCQDSPTSPTPHQSGFGEHVRDTLENFDPMSINEATSSTNGSLANAIVINNGAEEDTACFLYREGIKSVIGQVQTQLPSVTPDQFRFLESLKIAITSSHLVDRLRNAKSYPEAVLILREHPRLHNDLESNPILEDRFLQDPKSIQASLLSLKDQLCISDHSWKVIEEVFRLPRGLRIAQIRNLRKTIDTSRPISSTSVGVQNSFFSTLEYALRLEQPPETDIVQVKISFDAGRITNKIQEELTCLEIVSGKSTEQCKSNYNVHLLSLYTGESKGEDPESLVQLREQLSFVVEGIKSLQENNNIFKVDDKSYHIEMFLCADMKALALALGLNSVWHHQSVYRCCWCEVDKKSFSNWEVESWPFRCIEQMQTFSCKNKETTRMKAAKKNKGQVDLPVFPIRLDQTVPCLLHLSMSMVKLLLRSLAEHIWKDTESQTIFSTELEKLRIKLKQSKTPISFNERVRKSKFGRPELMRILENQDLVLTCLNPLDSSPSYKPGNDRLRLLFKQLWYLLSILSTDQRETGITEEEWISMAKKFASGFVDQNASEKVTTYLHIFVYHAGYFLVKCKNLEAFSNFSIEGTVQWVKKQTRNASNSFGGRSADKTSTLKQVLQKHNRMQEFMKTVLRSKEPRKYLKNWCLKINDCHLNKETLFPE